MTKDIKDYLQDSISILLAFCFACTLVACTIETSETSEATQVATSSVADGLYDMEKLSTLLPEGALIEDIRRQAKTLKVLYKVDGVSKTVHISPEDIMYETYDELCGWEQSEIDAIIETWEINNKTDVEFVDIEPRQFGYVIICTGNGLTYDLLCNDKKAFTTSKTEVEQAVIDKILEEYPNLTEPYSVTSVSEDEIIFVKDGKEFVISNEQD